VDVTLENLMTSAEGATGRGNHTPVNLSGERTEKSGVVWRLMVCVCVRVRLLRGGLC